MARWTITSKSSTAPVAEESSAPSGQAAPAQPAGALGQKPASNPIDQITSVVKTKAIRFEQMVGFGGEKYQRWFVPDMQVSIRGNGAPVVHLSGSSRGNSFVDYSKSDFPGVEWISEDNFTGVAKVSGQDCLIFRDKVKLDPENARSGRVAAVACIRLEDRLPIAVQIGQEVRTYQFGPAPTEMLVLPPEVDSLVDKWRKSLRQASLPAAKP